VGFLRVCAERKLRLVSRNHVFCYTCPIHFTIFRFYYPNNICLCAPCITYEVRFTDLLQPLLQTQIFCSAIFSEARKLYCPYDISRDSSVDIVTRLCAGLSGVWFPARTKMFFSKTSKLSLVHTHTYTHTHRYLVNGYCEENGWSVELTTHLYSVLRLTMNGTRKLLPLYVVNVCRGTILSNFTVLKICLTHSLP